MKKLFCVLLIGMILATVFFGCANGNDENITNDITASATETTETTATSTTEPTTELTTEPATQHTTVTTTKGPTTVSTTKKVTTTQKPTTTVASTKKETATQKSTTTKKETTTKPYYCDEGGTHHRKSVGQIGWYNSYNEALEALNLYMDKYGEGHYTIERCNCGLYTAFITLFDPDEQVTTTTKKKLPLNHIIAMKAEVTTEEM